MKNSRMAYVLSFILLLLIWKIAALAVQSPVLPAPELALQAFGVSLGQPRFWQHVGISTYRVCVSILLAWCLAFPAGMLLGYSERADRICSPMVFMSYPIPKMVLLPVILLLFGLGNLSKIILISLILFFQILVATRDGVKNLDPKYFASLRSMGATETDILREVVFPAALPPSFTALRISTGTAISVLFFAESFATTSGLGYLIMDAWALADYNRIFVGIIAMSLLGLLLYEVFRLLEHRVCAWRFVARETSKEANVFAKTVTYSRMIKLSHTIFALPFALASVVLVSRVQPLTVSHVVWIIVAMVGGRSAAMGFNRLVDAGIDAKNPRTVIREIPAGNISRGEAGAFVVFSAALFVFAAAMLSRLCFWLSFPVLAILFFYSFCKRFTWAAHLVLGFAIGMVPLAVWIAVAGSFSWNICLLCLTLLTYIAGFDILYACQDADFDRESGLHSIPAHFGVKRALIISDVLHVVSVGCMLSLFWVFVLGWIYLPFVALIAVLFIIEHRLVRPDDLSKVPVAFFNVNSAISLIIFVAVLAGELTRGVV